MTEWGALRDTYGSATGVPALLREAASTTDWRAPVWEELWSRLYHQGSVTAASHAALPSLAGIAGARPDMPLDPALLLAASIIASIDGPSQSAEVRRRYASQIAELRPIAEHKLDLVGERAEFLHTLQAVAALEDLSIWQRTLNGLANEEIETECPTCREHLYLELVHGTLVVTTDPDMVRDGRPVSPAEPSEFGAAEARLLDLCRSYRQTALEKELRQLFGRMECPNCGTHFTLSAVVA